MSTLHIEHVPDADTVDRLVFYPRMYDNLSGLFKELLLFEFKGDEPESVVWRKYARSIAEVHNLGREKERRDNAGRPPSKPQDYRGTMGANVGEVRRIRSNSGHGFDVVHEPSEGSHHCHVILQMAAGAEFRKTDKTDLRLRLYKDLSVNSIPLKAHPCHDFLRTFFHGGKDAENTILGGVGRLLGTGETAVASTRSRSEEEIPPQTWRWTEALGFPESVRGYHVCATYRLPVEGVAKGTIRQPQFGACLLPALGKSGSLPADVASRLGGI